jgi:hypothetical protein
MGGQALPSVIFFQTNSLALVLLPRAEGLFLFQVYSFFNADRGPVWHSSASPVELFFRKQLHEKLHEWGREPCFCSFTMNLTL